MRSFEAGGLIRFGSLTVPPERVKRGGSWNNKPRNLRSANRNRNTTENRNNNNGFRIARTLNLPERTALGCCSVCNGASRDDHDEVGVMSLLSHTCGEGTSLYETTEVLSH